MQCCNSFCHAPLTHVDLKLSPTDFSSTQKRKCHTDKLFTQNEQMCTQTALYATPQQITVSQIYIWNNASWQTKTFFFYFWRYCMVTVPLLPMHTSKTYLHKDIAGTRKIAWLAHIFGCLTPTLKYWKYCHLHVEHHQLCTLSDSAYECLIRWWVCSPFFFQFMLRIDIYIWVYQSNTQRLKSTKKQKSFNILSAQLNSPLKSHCFTCQWSHKQKSVGNICILYIFIYRQIHNIHIRFLRSK